MAAENKVLSKEDSHQEKLSVKVRIETIPEYERYELEQRLNHILLQIRKAVSA